MRNLFNKKGLLIAFFFGLTIVFPDLYPAITNIESWIPVNTPPYSIGDDYFYYGILNKFVQDGVSFPNDSFSVNYNLRHEFVRILGYGVNLPFYKLGTLILDQRLGILFVRFFNAFFLYLAIVYFFKQVSVLQKEKTNFIVIHLMSIVFFFFFKILYPPYTEILKIPDWFNGSYIYFHGQFNDLLRAIFSGTSGFIMLFSFGYLIKIFNKDEYSGKHFSIPVILFCLLSFVHLPSAIVILFVSGLLLLFKYKLQFFIKHKFYIAFVLFLFVLVFFVQKMILTSTEMSKEIFSTHIDLTLILSDHSFLIRYAKIGILAITPYIIPIISFYLFRKQIPKYIFIIFFALAFFSIGTIFESTHYNRFWYRSSIIIYIGLSVFFLINIFKRVLHQYLKERHINRIIAVFTISIWILMISFFIQNAIFMKKHFNRTTDKPELLQYILNNNDNENIILTNSSQIIYYINCYSHQTLFFQDYTLQPYGYKKNMIRTMRNFSLLGVAKEEFIDLFKRYSLNDLSEWRFKRPFGMQNERLFAKHIIYSTVFLATYSTYNNAMVADGMVTEEGNITDKFIVFIKHNYNETYRSNKTYDIILEKSVLNELNTDLEALSNMCNNTIELDNGEIIIFQNISFSKYL